MHQPPHPNPIEIFQDWLAEAHERGIPEENAMTLATASREGLPHTRTVLLKGVENGKFLFFTNYESTKARELLDNPHASLLFFWGALAKQVRVDGKVTKTSRTVSENYFATRPRESQIGAWASKQSSEIPSREYLERRVEETRCKYENQEIPCPPHWGGFQLDPSRIELWIGRPYRLHDRFVYLKSGEEWKITRLSP